MALASLFHSSAACFGPWFPRIISSSWIPFGIYRFRVPPFNRPLLVSTIGAIYLSAPVGAIVGGVVGGLILVTAVILGVMFTTGRLKTHKCFSRSKAPAVAAPGGESSGPGVRKYSKPPASSAASSAAAGGSAGSALPPACGDPDQGSAPAVQYPAVVPDVQYPTVAASDISPPTRLPPYESPVGMQHPGGSQ